VKRNIIILVLSVFCQLAQAQLVEKIISTNLSPRQKADTLQYLGHRFHMRALPDSAVYCYNLGLSFAKQVKNNDNQIVQLYLMLSRVSQMQRQPEKALATIRQADPYIYPGTPKTYW